MDRDLIVQALKKACGNKNIRFQVIVQNSKLHIYINRKADYFPDYVLLADNIKDAIASLELESLKGIWLYSRPLGKIDPDWQLALDPPKSFKEEEMDTLGNLGENRQEEINLAEFEPDDWADSGGDSGLLKDTGLIHEKPLLEAEISSLETETEPKPATQKSSLKDYCFVANKKILTGDIIPPDKKIVRLVKFFHHLSANNQQKILPDLGDYFKKGTIPKGENLPVAVKKWLKQIDELNLEERSSLAIWLSRYCFLPAETIAEFKTMEDKKVAAAKRSKRPHRPQEYNFTPANTAPSIQSEEVEFTPRQFQLPPIVKQSIIPLLWTCATVIIICLRIYLSSESSSVASPEIPSICQTSIGSSDYCRLGVNLAGKEAIAASAESIFPLTEITESVANYGCARFANVKAEAFSNLDPTQNPVISSQGEKIFPHVYVVQAVQKHSLNGENVRVGCVYTTGQGERSPKKLASEIIPLNWPTENYQPNNLELSNRSLKIFTNLVNLSLSVLFAAIGIAIAAELKLGLHLTDRPKTIYIIALVLGLIQLLALALPFFNSIASLSLSILTILICDRISDKFQLTWQEGKLVVAAGILTILAIQFILQSISLNLINGLV